MRRVSLVLAAVLLLAPAAAFADGLGNVVKVLRPKLNAFDETGAPAGQIDAKSIRTPAPIVGYGKGNSVGVKVDGKVVYLRGLDVQTDGAKAQCKPVQAAARASGSAYAATNMGLGGAADCQR
ncbi:MAG: hypothetical protein ABW042_06950 [Phenylobacterium sp.]